MDFLFRFGLGCCIVSQGHKTILPVSVLLMVMIFVAMDLNIRTKNEHQAGKV